MITKWKCPKHNAPLRTIEDYPDALVHDNCPEIFTIIGGCLCILDGNRWKDTKTGEYKEVTNEKR